MLHNESIAFLVIRVILGVLFFAQGYDKIFNVKIAGVIQTFRTPMQKRNVPDFLLVGSAYYTSIVELIGGLMLIVGLFKSYVLLALGIDLIMVVAAFSIIKPMWDMQFVFPRLMLLAALLIMPVWWDVYSLDHYFEISKVLPR